MSQIDFKERCEKDVKSIVKTINDMACRRDWEEIREYFGDVYDIEFRIDRDREYRSVKVAIAIGGPNIYVDTRDSYVRLYWGNTEVEEPLSYAASEMIDDYFKDEWNCC